MGPAFLHRCPVIPQVHCWRLPAHAPPHRSALGRGDLVWVKEINDRKETYLTTGKVGRGIKKWSRKSLDRSPVGVKM